MQIATTLDCGAIDEIEVIVYFDYQPFEAAVMNPIEDAEPGCAESAEISSVTAEIGGVQVELLPLITAYDINELETECKESV